MGISSYTECTWLQRDPESMVLGGSRLTGRPRREALAICGVSRGAAGHWSRNRNHTMAMAIRLKGMMSWQYEGMFWESRDSAKL